MADWSDPATWKDVRKFNAAVDGLQKRAEAAKQGGGAAAADPAITADLVAVLRGHQKNLVDLNEVAGKLAVYTTAIHERKQREVEALAQVVKAIKRLTKDMHKLSRRVGKL